MPCFSPKRAYQSEDGTITFSETKKTKKFMWLPCSQCIGCRLERSRQWAIRCMHESQMHKKNSYITLTYSDDHVQLDLVYKHFQDFLKRLRKIKKIRFYMCGEYGDQTGRPHFHACIFGYDFPDRKYYSERDQVVLYTSAELQKLWSFGFSTVGDVTFESAAYVARYVMKKITGPAAEQHYWSVNPVTGEAVQITPEFNKMSLKPGIGHTWLQKYKSDVYPNGTCVVNGQKVKPPRAYDKYFKESDPFKYEDLQHDRLTKMNHADNTFARLAVKEQVVSAKLKFKKRTI